MEGHHHMGIPELDLRTCHPSSIADRINHAVPGLKPSAAFFTFLRANLVMNSSAMSSHANTPQLAPSPSQVLTRPSPSPLAAARLESAPVLDDDIPPLSLEVLSGQADKAEAMKLVADSIAEQRQQACVMLIFHPICLSVIGVLLYLASQYRARTNQDLGMSMVMFSGITMAYLLAIRFATGGYIRLAEGFDWRSWLLRGDGEEEIIVGARFGHEIIGALVLRLEPSAILSPRKKHRSLTLKGGKGVIRAWTTKLRYRHRGMGMDLLNEAVRITREKCGKDAEVGFAQEHANSSMVLPELFNSTFRKQEMKAAKMLERVGTDREASRRKR